MTTEYTFGLSSEDYQKIKILFSKFEKVQQVLVFGSRALGSYRPNSDIDLAVDAPSMSLDDQLELTNQLDDLNLPYKIDLVNLQEVDRPSLLEHIKKHGKSF